MNLNHGLGQQHSPLLHVLLLLLVIVTAAADAQQVELNVGTITGTVQVGNSAETQIQRVTISSTFAGQSSSLTVTPSAPSNSVSYSTSVSAPSSGTSTGIVQATDVRMDQFRDRLIFPSTAATVSANQTTSGVNFGIPSPGFIEGTVAVTGGTLSSASINVNPATFPGVQSFTSTSSAQAGQYRVPVAPGTGLRVFGTAFTSTGSVVIPEQVVNVAAGETVMVNITVAAPILPPQPATGTVAGSVSFAGPNVVNSYSVRVPTSASLTPPFGVDYSKSFSVTANEGVYSGRASASLNGGDDSITFPSSAFVTGNSVPNTIVVTGGQVSPVNIAAFQAGIVGTVTVTGPIAPTDITSLTAFADGISGTSTQEGASSDRVVPSTGAMDLVVTPGSWRVYRAQANVFRNSANPAEYLNAVFTYNDQQLFNANVVVGADGQPAARNLTIPLGKTTLTVTSPAGTTFSNPSLFGSCTLRNAGGQTLATYSGIGASSTGQNNVTTGVVTFFGAGDCTITPRVVVGGVTLSLGTIAFYVAPGTSQQVDVGSPTLTIMFPEADIAIDSSQVSVSGLATDDVQVASVTVNGQAATLTPTGNPADPRQVSFMATVGLPQKGPNTITTVATDTSGRVRSDTRTVYNDSGSPQVVWTPLNGATTNQSLLTVSGTATDDAGVQSVTVNGVVASLSPPSGNSVAFSVPVTLAPGLNQITVVVRDISLRLTNETRTVSFVQAVAPVVTPSISGTMGNGGWYVSDVVVSWDIDDGGAAVSSSSGCSASTISVDTAATELTCSATNLAGTGTASVTVKRDATAPTVALSATNSPNMLGWYRFPATFDVTGSDPSPGSGLAGCDGPITVNTQGSNLTATGLCTDVAGNQGSDSETGLNIDWTAPSITSTSKSPPANANGWNNTDVQVTVNSTDSLSGVVGCTPGTEVTFSAEGAGQAASIVCTDRAGNDSAPSAVTVSVDKTAPEVTATRSPTANPSGWNNADVTVSYSGSDALSGIADCDGSDVLSSEGAAQSATGSCADLAGNTGSATQSGIAIDKTAPSVVVSTPGESSYLINAPVLASYNCNDGLSGIASCTAPVQNGDLVNTSASGSFTANGVDRAGNSATDTNTYTVRYGVVAFLQPIDNLPVFNAATAGRTIPVKWQLLDGNGAHLTSLLTFRSLGSVASACDSGAPLDDIEETLASGGTVLRYDATTNQFIYNWATASSWKGKCRRLVLELADGQKKEAMFRFR